MATREMMLEGVLGILEGINPRVIEEKLNGYLSHEERKSEKEKVPQGKANAVPA
jgi:flagellar motor component MotA